MNQASYSPFEELWPRTAYGRQPFQSSYQSARRQAKKGHNLKFLPGDDPIREIVRLKAAGTTCRYIGGNQMAAMSV